MEDNSQLRLIEMIKTKKIRENIVKMVCRNEYKTKNSLLQCLEPIIKTINNNNKIIIIIDKRNGSHRKGSCQVHTTLARLLHVVLLHHACCSNVSHTHIRRATEDTRKNCPISIVTLLLLLLLLLLFKRI